MKNFSALLLALSISAQAQELPPAPKPHLITLDRALFAADLTIRILDVTSTHSALNSACRCNHEADPIAPSGTAWVPNILFQAGMLALVSGSSAILHHHHHNQLARLPVIYDIANETHAVVGNVRLK